MLYTLASTAAVLEAPCVAAVSHGLTTRDAAPAMEPPSRQRCCVAGALSAGARPSEVEAELPTVLLADTGRMDTNCPNVAALLLVLLAAPALVARMPQSALVPGLKTGGRCFAVGAEEVTRFMGGRHESVLPLCCCMIGSAAAAEGGML